MYRFSIFILLIALALVSCNNDQSADGDGNNTKDKQIKEVSIDLDQIRERGKLVALSSYSSTSYFLYRGRTMGYEYELLRRLAEDLDLELEIRIAHDMDSIIRMLKEGEGDIISHGLTVTKERKERVAFTDYHTKTHQVLVQRKPENWRQMMLHNIDKQLIRDPLELIGKEVHVREKSSYYQRLLNLEDEIGGDIDIVTVEGDRTTEELIKMVADGEIDYTIADQNIAAINATYLPILDVETAVSFNQRIAWAVRNSSPELLGAVNDWIGRMKKDAVYYVIYNKYFKNKKAFKKRAESEYFSIAGDKISPYDKIIMQHADSIGWDWRLLASMIYQESGFDPRAESWAGAKGLMQMMPATARHFGLKDPYDPAQSIEAGVAYLERLMERYDEMKDSVEQTKFVLASYNVGPSHVQDAMRLAEKYGKDPLRWDGHVAEYILLKSKPEYYTDEVVKYGYCRGTEPFNYVKEIFERFHTYKEFIESPGVKASL